MQSKAAKKKAVRVVEQVTLGPNAPGQTVFGVAHIFASFNDTFVHVTDLSGRETYVRITGGMKVKSDRDESSPYAAMLAAQDVAARCKQIGITALHIKVSAPTFFFLLPLLVCSLVAIRSAPLVVSVPRPPAPERRARCARWLTPV